MPVSRSPSRSAKPAPQRDAKSVPRPSRLVWAVVLIGLAAVLAAVISALPAAMIAHWLPSSIQAEDFSGSIWHGSAGKISVNAHDSGALEWRLHPASLLHRSVAADLHWVKGGFVVDAAVNIDRQGFTAQAVRGGGPIEDLHDLGVAAGWRGMAYVNFSEIKSDFIRPLAAVGDVRVLHVTAEPIAPGADLGSYDLTLPEGAVGADGNVAAQITDAGGPFELQALIRYAPNEHLGTLSGTLKARPGAPPALLNPLENLAQLRGRDPQGRIPVDLEFAL